MVVWCTTRVGTDISISLPPPDMGQPCAWRMGRVLPNDHTNGDNWWGLHRSLGHYQGNPMGIVISSNIVRYVYHTTGIAIFANSSTLVLTLRREFHWLWLLIKMEFPCSFELLNNISTLLLLFYKTKVPYVLELFKMLFEFGGIFKSVKLISQKKKSNALWKFLG